MIKNVLQPGEIYAAAVLELPARDIDHHNSDLYLKHTPASVALLERLENRVLLTTFRDPDGVFLQKRAFSEPEAVKKVACALDLCLVGLACGAVTGVTANAMMHHLKKLRR